MGPRFLISRLSALGDVVCSLPAATALKNGFPDSHITWVVDPRFAGIVECCESVDEVVRAKPGLRPETWPRYPEPFEAALDLQGLLKSALCIYRAKAEQKVGYHWQREGSALFSSQVLPDPTSYHIVDQYVDVARAIGGVMDAAEFRLKPKPEDAEKIDALLRENGVQGKFVVINAGAGWITKRWPPACFAEVIEMLSRRGVQSVLVGAKGPDQEVVASVREALAKSGVTEFVDFAGKTSVRELVALIARADVHLGGDTGTTHIAAALRTPAVGLYSITRPKRSCPYGQIDRCHYDPDSLANIPAEAVFESLVAATQ